MCLWLAYAFGFSEQHSLTVCPTKLLLHIPCPGCGTTRAAMLFLTGHCIDAVALNPNVLFAVIFLVAMPIVLIYDGITRRKMTVHLYKRCERALRNKWILIAFFVVEAGIWIHNIVLDI